MKKVLVIFKGVDFFGKSFSYYKVCEESEVESLVADNYRKSTEVCGYEVIKEIDTDLFYGVVKSSKRYE